MKLTFTEWLTFIWLVTSLVNLAFVQITSWKFKKQLSLGFYVLIIIIAPLFFLVVCYLLGVTLWYGILVLYMNIKARIKLGKSGYAQYKKLKKFHKALEKEMPNLIQQALEETMREINK